VNVLVACEFSGIVREAFERRGFNATSCDLLPTEKPGQHYQGDVADILYQDWDLIIAHPPCTYLCNSGVRWLFEDRKTETAKERKRKMKQAHDFFMMFRNHPTCKYIAIENPIPHKYAELPKYTQTVQPYDFFPNKSSKRTCFWLQNLPPLVPNQVIPKEERTYEIHNITRKVDRWIERSRTFEGIANAMADQWGAYITSQNLPIVKPATNLQLI
jgi:hypothetical protein